MSRIVVDVWSYPVHGGRWDERCWACEVSGGSPLRIAHSDWIATKERAVAEAVRRFREQRTR